jgi:hypothetical protein
LNTKLHLFCYFILDEILTDFGFKKIFGENIDYWDLKNVMDTAVEEAVDNNKREIAKNLKKLGLSHEDIAKGTGLSIDEIKQL